MGNLPPVMSMIFLVANPTATDAAVVDAIASSGVAV